MEDSQTLSSDRVMISEPEHEWGRQWISPDDSKTAYSTRVNEVLQSFESKNKDKVLIYYCASGSQTPYYYIGLLTTDAGGDLTDVTSREKLGMSVSERQPEDSVFRPDNPSFIPSPDGKEWHVLCHARGIPNNVPGITGSHGPRLQKTNWDADGMLLLGRPHKGGAGEK